MEAVGPIASRPLRLVELPDPEPGCGEIRVRVSVCALCRTDLHVIEGDLPRREMPIVPGHQVVGIVDKLGEGCTRLKLGERVGIAWLRSTCGECRFCRAGKENLCPHAQFTGWTHDGGYAELATVREDFAYRIPEGFSDVEASPLLCAGIIGYRSLQRANPFEGCRLALYGFGSSGHVVMQIARARGYEVYVATRGEGHRQLARELGAKWVGEHPSELPVKVDSAIVFAPAGELIPPGMEALEKGGTLACAGIHMSGIPAMGYERCLFHERDLRSVTCNTRADGRGLLEEAARISIRPHTTEYPLEEANAALAEMKADRINGTGVLVVGD